MPTVAQLQSFIRKHKDKNCPAFSKLKKAQLLALVKQLGIDAQNRGVGHLRAHKSDMSSACQKWFGVHVIDINTAGGKKLRIFFA